MKKIYLIPVLLVVAAGLFYYSSKDTLKDVLNGSGTKPTSEYSEQIPDGYHIEKEIDIDIVYGGYPEKVLLLFNPEAKESLDCKGYCDDSYILKVIKNNGTDWEEIFKDTFTRHEMEWKKFETNVSNPKEPYVLIAYQFASTFNEYLLINDGFGKIIMADASTDSQINEGTVVQGNFRGYFEEKNIPAEYDETFGQTFGPYNCKDFVVISGHSGLIEYFKNMVLRGNTIQTITNAGELKINLPWEEVPYEQQQQILNSTKLNPVDIQLEKKVQSGKRGDPCYSFFKFINVIE